jgi:protein-tyrosine phosphatase
MFEFFRKKQSPTSFLRSLKTDLHSHLIPGIDDGVDNLEESLEIARGFEDLGYQHLITTPHIYNGVYNNDASIIKKGYETVKDHYHKNGLKIKFSVAAEYFIDEIFLQMLHDEQELLTFGKNLLLVETAFFEPPLIFDEVIFMLKSRGISPVYAHPERYVYLQQKPSLAKHYIEKGLIFQLNFLSLSGFYSVRTQELAIEFLKAGYYSLIGSDCHKPIQLENLKIPIPAKTLELLSKSNFSNINLK